VDVICLRLIAFSSVSRLYLEPLDLIYQKPATV
jgi:hypothetical protein